MRKKIRFWFAMVLAGVVLCLSACGGGGDAEGPFRDATMSLDTSAVNMTVFYEDMSTFVNDPRNTPIFERTIQFQGLSLRNLPDDFVLAAIVGDEASLSHLYISFAALDSQRVLMYVRPSGFLSAGEYSGEFRLVACRLDKQGENCV